MFLLSLSREVCAVVWRVCGVVVCYAECYVVVASWRVEAWRGGVVCCAYVVV